MINGSFLDMEIEKETQLYGNSPDERLEKYHLESLNRLLVNSSKSTFYREHYKGIDLSKIETISDFEKLPFVFPEDLKKNSKKFLTVSQDAIERIITLNTSGTTGPSKRVFFTGSDTERTKSFFKTVISQMMEVKKRALVLLPSDTPSSAGDLLKTSIEKMGAICEAPGIVTDFDKTCRMIMEFKPNLIIGLPVQLLIIGEILKEKKEDTGYVNNIILTSDIAAQSLKKRIKENFSCNLYDHYGMTETGFGGGIDCSFHNGYHLRELDLYFEIVDPENGKRVRDGESGEIVVTTINYEGTPLLRYRTGDISRVLKEKCSCRSPYKRLDYIKRRVDNSIYFSDSDLGISDLDEFLFSIENIVDYEVSISSQKSCYKMDLTIKVIEMESKAVAIAEKEIRNSVLFKEFLTIDSLKFLKVAPLNTYTGKRKILFL